MWECPWAFSNLWLLLDTYEIAYMEGPVKKYMQRKVLSRNKSNDEYTKVVLHVTHYFIY